MVDYEKDAVLEIRNYLWHKIKEQEILDPELYRDSQNNLVVPIIPVQQVPEMTQEFITELGDDLDNDTHIVYDKIGISYEDNWVICCEQIVFTIYSTSYSKITTMRNFMMDLFRRMDESARDINAWNGKSAEFKFHSIYIADISPTQPSQEIQGFLAEEIVLEVKYSRHADQFGRFI